MNFRIPYLVGDKKDWNFTTTVVIPSANIVGLSEYLARLSLEQLIALVWRVKKWKVTGTFGATLTQTDFTYPTPDFTYATSADRLADGDYSSSVGAIGYESDDNSYWRLIDYIPSSPPPNVTPVWRVYTYNGVTSQTCSIDVTMPDTTFDRRDALANDYKERSLVSFFSDAFYDQHSIHSPKFHFLSGGFLLQIDRVAKDTSYSYSYTDGSGSHSGSGSVTPSNLVSFQLGLGVVGYTADMNPFANDMGTGEREIDIDNAGMIAGRAEPFGQFPPENTVGIGSVTQTADTDGTATFDPIICDTFQLPVHVSMAYSQQFFQTPYFNQDRGTLSGQYADITVEAVEFYPYANSEGLPIYDSATGDQLRDPLS